MGARDLPFRLVADDDGRDELLSRVSVRVIDARGNEREVVGQVMELELPEGVEWPNLPDVGDDGRSHYMQQTAPGEVECLPECWCQKTEGDA